MRRQSSGGCGCLAQERGGRRHHHSLAVVGSRAGVEAPICLNELSIKRRVRICGEKMASAVNETSVSAHQRIHSSLYRLHLMMNPVIQTKSHTEVDPDDIWEKERTGSY